MNAVGHTSKSVRAFVVGLRRTTRPQTIYMSPGKLSFPVVIYSSCIINLIFWGNLSQWVFSDYAVHNETTSTYEKASIWKRSLYSGLLATTGLGISAAFAFVSKRVVKRIDIMSGGKSVALYTGFFSREAAKHSTEIPIGALTLKRSMFTGQGINGAHSSKGTFTQLLRQNQMIGYLVDRRGFFDPKVLDELFYSDQRSR